MNYLRGLGGGRPPSSQTTTPSWTEGPSTRAATSWAPVDTPRLSFHDNEDDARGRVFGDDVDRGRRFGNADYVVVDDDADAER